jgi:asparagine synthase (glutamine-hydrolysing)
MCGICGIVNFDGRDVEEHELRLMMQTMKHRGPNDDGVFKDGNTGLGFVRLSILDLSPAGHQPMLSQDGRYALVFNGEVYNYIELKQQLNSKYSFRTKTDTEALLTSYMEWGEGCMDYFNGMFAFGVYDKQQKSLFIARDRFGVKPFYYYLDSNRFIFASEIQPILAVLPGKPRPNNQVIFDYLTFNRTDHTEETFFEGIKKLQHGHSLKVGRNGISIKRWYNLREKNQAPFNSPQEYQELFRDAVKLRLRADVPVGVCLSGGLDSSSITSLLIQEHPSTNQINTFSAVYGKSEYADESSFIDEYKSQLKNMFYTYPSADTLFADMDKFIMAHGEPMPRTTPYAEYKVMELAKEHVVVTLVGQGADEQLGGYHYFFGTHFKGLLRQFALLKLLSEMHSYYKNHQSTYGLKTFAYFLLPSFLKTYARVSEHGYIHKTFSGEYSGTNRIASELYDSDDLTDALYDHFEYKMEHLLKWGDRNSMWFSLESRFPFLDYRLVEKTLAMPADMIIKKGYTKHILREAMKGVLPERIRMRMDKKGFETPQDKWFRTPKFQQMIFDLLGSSGFKNRGYIDPEKALALYKMHLAGDVSIGQEIWKWLHLELWCRTYLEKNSMVELETKHTI